MQSQRPGGRGERFPKTQDRVEQDAVGQPLLDAAVKAVGLAPGGLRNEPQLDEWAVEGVFGKFPPALPRRDIGAKEHFHVPLQRGFRNLFSRERLRPLVKRGEESLARELRLVEVAESPEPGRGPGPVGRNLPVQQPECGRVFEVGVQPVVGKEESPKFGGVETSPDVLVLRQDASCQTPVTDGADHVLADAKSGNRVVTQKNERALQDGVQTLLQPGVTKRKGLVP